jgi:ClpP class serine protease
MAITDAGLNAIHAVVRNHLVNGSEWKASIADLFENEDDPNQPYDAAEGVRVVPVYGSIGYKVSALEKSCGVCDIGDMCENIESAVNDPTVNTIVMDFNSPGGEVTYLKEASQRIMEAGKKKNIVGYTDTMACSAAQWLMAACNERYATRTADLGSVGVIVRLFDTTEMYKKEGIEVIQLASGDLKGIGFDGVDVKEIHKKYMQEEVNKLGNDFRSWMKSRMNMEDEDMRGQTLSGEHMASKGYLDGLVLTMRDIF